MHSNGVEIIWDTPVESGDVKLTVCCSFVFNRDLMMIYRDIKY